MKNRFGIFGLAFLESCTWCRLRSGGFSDGVRLRNPPRQTLIYTWLCKLILNCVLMIIRAAQTQASVQSFSSVLGESMLFSTLVMREDGQTSQWAEMFEVFRDLSFKYHFGMILTSNCPVHQYPTLPKWYKSCFVSVFQFSDCLCWAMPWTETVFHLTWLFRNKMLEGVFIGYKNPSSMDLFGSKMLKAEHQGPLAVPGTLHGWVGWWSHWEEGLSLVFQSHSGSHCDYWGPHSRKCLSCLWKGVTEIELPAASWWLCPQRMCWVERGPQGSWSPAQWDLFPFCSLRHSLTGILLQFLFFQVLQHLLSPILCSLGFVYPP